MEIAGRYMALILCCVVLHEVMKAFVVVGVAAYRVERRK